MIRKSGNRFSEKIMLHQNARAQFAAVGGDLRASGYLLVWLPLSSSRPSAAAATRRAHRLRAGESRKSLRIAHRGFQILVGIFRDKNIFVGVNEMVRPIGHGFHPFMRSARLTSTIRQTLVIGFLCQRPLVAVAHDEARWHARTYR